MPKLARGPAIAALLVVVLAVGCGPRFVAPSPTPTPTATPVAEPTPTPTRVPTPSPTRSPSPTPQPTQRPQTERPVTYDAGTRLLPFYFEIRPMFPLLPPAPEIMPDDAPGYEANATFHGLTPSGIPRFSVRDDFVMDKGTAAHEIGHAYQKLLERATGKDVLTLYWAFRGFPGTWQQAEAEARKQPSAAAGWLYQPIESWAEAFRAAVTLETKEKTLDYGKTIDPPAMREFFRSLANGS